VTTHESIEFPYCTAVQSRSGEELKGKSGLAGATAPSNDVGKSVSRKERSLPQFRKCVRKIQRKQLSFQ